MNSATLMTIVVLCFSVAAFAVIDNFRSVKNLEPKSTRQEIMYYSVATTASLLIGTASYYVLSTLTGLYYGF